MSYPYPVSVIPGPNDFFSVSQGQIQTNFANLIGWSAVDHYAYGATNAGTHEQVTFSNITSQSSPLDPVSILYTKNDAASHPQLFFLNSQNSSSYLAAQNGSTVLMGGIILKWGTINFTSASQVVTYDQPFPNNAWAITLSANTTTPAVNGIISFSSTTTSGFNAHQNGSGFLTAKYIAVGN